MKKFLQDTEDFPNGRNQRRKQAFGRLGSICEYSDLLSVDFLNYESKSEEESSEECKTDLHRVERLESRGVGLQVCSAMV
mmetsp:Transcript_18056/g.22904  ORF Transcript_18056/g.22904 Transcript_18056/m.22904 type:complete len:80 (+) Transcript_18056:52-291(+)